MDKSKFANITHWNIFFHWKFLEEHRRCCKMEFWESLVHLFVYIITFAIGNLATYVIQLYYRNKPLGMQTILDRVIVLFVNVVYLVCLDFTFVIFVFHLLCPLESEPAIALMQVTGKQQIFKSGQCQDQHNIKLSF